MLLCVVIIYQAWIGMTVVHASPGVSLKMTGSGFHRHVEFEVARKGALMAFIEYRLPKDCFVDPYQTDGRVARVSHTDLEVRSDDVEALEQTIAFNITLVNGYGTFSLPIHFRYPSLSKDASYTRRVSLPHSPHVWVQGESGDEFLELRGDVIPSLSAEIPCGRQCDIPWVWSMTCMFGMLGFLWISMGFQR